MRSMNYDFETNLAARLEAMLEAKNPDDIPFLVACVRHWHDQAKELAARVEDDFDSDW